MFKKIHAFRIKPKQDLLEGIQEFCENNDIISGVVIGIIGSLEEASLNFLKSLPANYINKKFHGPLEIDSAQGSIAKHDEKTVVHIHLTISTDKETYAGHLAKGCKIFSTAEVVIGELKEHLNRNIDKYTGLLELED